MVAAFRPRSHGRSRRLLTVAMAATCVVGAAGAAGVARTAYDYFRQPSDPELRAALTRQFPYHAAGLDRRTARVDEIDVVRYGAMSVLRIADPKMWVWVRAQDGHGQRAAGLAYLDVFDSEGPVKRGDARSHRVSLREGRHCRPGPNRFTR